MKHLSGSELPHDFVNFMTHIDERKLEGDVKALMIYLSTGTNEKKPIFREQLHFRVQFELSKHFDPLNKRFKYLGDSEQVDLFAFDGDSKDWLLRF
jgi:hypothetical protein